MKTAFLTIDIDTGKAVQDFNSLKKAAKELEQQFKGMKPDDNGFEELKQKVILAKTEIFKFNEQLRVTPSFTEKLSNSIKIGMADVAIKAGKAEQAIHSLKAEQQDLVREINLTSDAVKKNNLVEEFKKLETQIKKNQTELHNFNQELNKGFSENKKQVGDFSIQVDKNFKETNNIISGSVKKIGNAFSEIGLAIGGAFAVEKILQFGAECVKAFAEAELNAKKLQTAVGVNGGLQEDFQKLIEQSEELQGKTIFSDDAIQKAQTAALQFGLTADQVQRLIPVISDFASATGQDLGSALDAVLRGAEGSAKGLKQYGISIDESQSGTAKLADIVGQLNKKFEGQAEIVAGTTSGSYELLKNKIDDVKESIGGFISDLAGGAVDIAAFALNGFQPLNDQLTQTSDKLFKTREELVKFNATTTAAQISFLKTKIEELNKTDSGVAVAELSKQLKVAEQRLQEYNKEQLTFLSDTEIKKKFTELQEQVKNTNSIFGDTTGIKEQFEVVKQELEKRRLVVLTDEKDITTASSQSLQTRLVELKKVYAETNSFQTKSAIEAIESELKARKDGASKIQSELKKQYDEGLKIIQTANETEILSTKEGTIERLNVKQAAIEKERKYQVDHLSELIQSEGRYVKDSTDFETELARRKENIIVTSNDKIIQLEQQKQTLLKSLFEKKQAANLEIFPEGTIERIEQQIKQAQERLSFAFTSSQTAFSIVPTFDVAAMVKYASEIKKLYQDLSNYNASLKKTELLTEQSTIEAKLAAAKKGSQEELDLKNQLIANKAALDKNEIDSKLAAYDAIRAAGIELNEKELADYKKLQADKAAVTAQANAETQTNDLEHTSLLTANQVNYSNATLSAFSQAYDAINNLERQRTDVQIQSIESSLNKTINSLNKQEEQELKTSTNKEATRIKFAKKKELAEQQAHKQESALKKKQFEADKKASIVKAIIGTATAVIGALGTTPFFPLGLIMAALAAVAGGIQINAISNAPTPEFAKGGLLNISKYKEGGQLNIEKYQDGGKLSIEKYEQGGKLKVAKYKDGGQIHIEKYQDGGKLEVTKFKDGGQLNVEKFEKGGKLQIEKYKEGGNLNVTKNNQGNVLQINPSNNSTSVFAAAGENLDRVGTVVKQLRTFAAGGNTQGIVQGASHSNGGIKLVNADGQIKGEIEGNEIILTKGVAANASLLKQASDINVLGGGKPFLAMGGMLQPTRYVPTKLESGGVLGSTNVNVNNTVDFEALKEFLSSELDKPRRSYVVGSDVTEAQNIDSVIERRSRLAS